LKGIFPRRPGRNGGARAHGSGAESRVEADALMERRWFDKKVALVTGSSRGIGNAIARKFAGAGCDVVVNYRKAGGASQRQAEELCGEIRSLGRQAAAVQADISVKDSVGKMFEEIQDRFGALDFLVLNAARAPFKPLEKLLERELRQLVETNFFGHLFCVQGALPMLEKTQGKVVFLSSLGSRFYNPSYPLGSMKAAMECVVRDLAESLRDRQVAVNGICAGLARTDSLKVLRQYWEGLERLPDRYFVEPDEIADVVLFLCGPGSRGILGQTLVVDRGTSNRLYLPVAMG
jgi:NAD(P)-dependent dehydrogenase (short-subunit alcohol dehydrogenase family)